MSDQIFCLSGIKVLQDLTDEEIAEISSGVKEAEYNAGEIIYIPSESEGKIFFLREGEVDIYQKAASGKKFIISTMEPGDMFGDITLVPRSTEGGGNFAKAATKTKVCVVDKVEFMDYLQRKPQIAYRIIEELSTRLATTESKVRDLALNNVTIRLLNELIRLADQYGQTQDNETIIKKRFTHEELADRISATRETVTKVINDLEKKKFIRYDSERNIILNRDKTSTIL